jgi:hypothetical protein
MDTSHIKYKKKREEQEKETDNQERGVPALFGWLLSSLFAPLFPALKLFFVSRINPIRYF